MKNTIKYLLLLMLVVPAAISCESFLDKSSSTQVDAEKMFSSEQGFKDALTACYIKMTSVNLYGQSLTMTHIEYLAQHWTTTTSNINELKELTYDTKYSESLFSSIYGEMYNVIVQANDVLANIRSNGGVIRDPDLRGVIEAEALALRAFCHMDILRLFGQVPANATITVRLPYAEEVTREKIPYYDYAAFTNLILRDLDAAEALFAEHDPLLTYSYLAMDEEDDNDVDENFLQYRRFRMNYYAVKAVKARLYLYMGNTTEAYRYAKQVVDATDSEGSPIIELTGPADLNANYYGLPRECLFALNDYKLEEKSKILAGTDLYLQTARFDEMFQGQSLSINNRATIVWDRTFTNPQGVATPIIRKYKQPGDDESVSSKNLAARRQVIPMVRLSEMYLIMIETTTSDTEANTLYKTYMESHNVDVTTNLTRAELDTEIMLEYRREFWAEGQMFYTYKRTGSTSMWWRGEEVEEVNYVVPLPPSEPRS